MNHHQHNMTCDEECYYFVGQFISVLRSRTAVKQEYAAAVSQSLYKSIHIVLGTPKRKGQNEKKGLATDSCVDQWTSSADSFALLFFFHRCNILFHTDVSVAFLWSSGSRHFGKRGGTRFLHHGTFQTSKGLLVLGRFTSEGQLYPPLHPLSYLISSGPLSFCVGQWSIKYSNTGYFRVECTY